MLLLSRTSCLTVGAVSVLIGMLSGCAPTPDPKPSPTPAFASDEEAFAAAEKVYREYVGALNARNAGDADPHPQDFLRGSALEGDIDAQRYLDSAGLTLQGPIVIASLDTELKSMSAMATNVIGYVCLDLAGARTIDSSGMDVTPSDRPDVLSQEVTLTHVDGRFVITDEQKGDDQRCAS